MKTCKHPIENIKIQDHYDSSPDGYGGYNEWNWNELECTKCKKSVKIESGDFPYSKLTGRTVDLEECKKIFLKNKHLYDNMPIHNDRHDIVLRTVGKRTDELGKKIEKKKKTIKKHQKELEQMLSDYHGRPVSIYDLRF